MALLCAVEVATARSLRPSRAKRNDGAGARVASVIIIAYQSKKRGRWGHIKKIIIYASSKRQDGNGRGGISAARVISTQRKNALLRARHLRVL